MLSIDELKELLQPQGLCVSIFMPMHRAGSEVQQNPIRFKDLIKQAEDQLQAHDMRRTDAVALLEPAHSLDQTDFWENQDEGLAVFIAEGWFRYYKLPMRFEELVVVSDRFHLKPLIPLLNRDGEFYILALSQKQVRFFEGSRYSIKQVEIENLPQNIDETLQYDETAQEGQFRINTSKGGTNNPFQRSGSYHGQGAPDRDYHNRDILQFFHQIDAALHPFLKDKRAPLVLVGVEYLLPIYREANTYQHLLEEGVTESPKVVSPEELHDQAWAIVEPCLMQQEQVAIEYYQNLSATGKTSTDLKEAVSGAYYGRVEQLFVAVGRQRWGNFDPDSNELHMHETAEPGDEDLLNAAALQTLLNGGTVYAVEPEKVPDSALVAAVFRY
ncbi:hypothetical protein H6G89_07570 [Oscillatoria sp. FACHB-1407]|uniref:baeRF7 domain-containing protein n=1 Tax=Oscillatoria sp. FACHB-1407 TaxID=2692847 RepID=UPI00168720E2|nr:hypothetical protein [Oscillatoria sp. FACHB-1407]MBD2460901.1 hypothetical protein [Oscillatoria sp. FACHB-1407]